MLQSICSFKVPVIQKIKTFEKILTFQSSNILTESQRFERKQNEQIKYKWASKMVWFQFFSDLEMSGSTSSLKERVFKQ